MNADRSKYGEGHTFENDPHDDDPDWVKTHAVERQKVELVKKEEDLQHRIALARERRSRHRMDTIARGNQDANKRSKRSKYNNITHASDSDSDSGYIAEPYQDGETAYLEEGSNDPLSYLSPAVKALMERSGMKKEARRSVRPFYSRVEEDKDLEDEIETVPKIIYASRTHSQISQFVGELKKTVFGINSTSVQDEPKSGSAMRSISIGSRKQMCINISVRRIGHRYGVEAMNEKCLDLMRGTHGTKCSCLPSADEAGQAQMLEYRDSAFSEVQDIEQLVELGKEMNICPYFGARGSGRQAQIVTIPYNLLLSQSARQTLNIDFKDSIVIIDEAHNLIDTILSTYSVSINSVQIEQSIQNVEQYLRRFSTRLKGKNEANIKKLLKFMHGLFQVCSNLEDVPKKSVSWNSSELLRNMGDNVDQVNLMDLEAWLRETKIARKMAGYAQKIERGNDEQRANDQLGSNSGSSIAALHAIESLLLSLVNRDLDGRIFLSQSVDSKMHQRKGTVSLKYQLLNPSHVFKKLADESRAVILAGGTMEPFSDFETQLFPSLDPARFTRFSCGHIIPAQNLLAGIVCKGAKGSNLELKFDTRNDVSIVSKGIVKNEVLIKILDGRTVNVADEFLQCGPEWHRCICALLWVFGWTRFLLEK